MREERRLKRKVRNSYFVSTLSIALVLFLLGSVGYLMLVARQLASTLQGSMVVMVELERDHTEEQSRSVADLLAAEVFGKRV